MHVGDYRELMRATMLSGENATDPDAYQDNKKGAFDNATMCFRHDLAKGKIVWEGQWGWDLWHYFKNNHEFLSLLKAPKVHPFSRKERIYVLTCQLILNSIFALISSNLDDIRFDLGFGVVSMLSNKILTCSATCGCVQNSKTNRRKCCELFGHCFMCIYGSFVVLVCGGLWYLVIATGGVNVLGFLQSYAITTGSSWLLSIFSLTIQYCICARRERKGMEQHEQKYMKKKGYYVSYLNQQKYWTVYPKKKGKKGQLDVAANSPKSPASQPVIQFVRPVWVIGPDGTQTLAMVNVPGNVPTGSPVVGPAIYVQARTQSMSPVMVANPAQNSTGIQRTGTVMMVANPGYPANTTQIQRSATMVVQGAAQMPRATTIVYSGGTETTLQQQQPQVIYSQ